MVEIESGCWWLDQGALTSRDSPWPWELMGLAGESDYSALLTERYTIVR